MQNQARELTRPVCIRWHARVRQLTPGPCHLSAMVTGGARNEWVYFTGTIGRRGVCWWREQVNAYSHLNGEHTDRVCLLTVDQ